MIADVDVVIDGADAKPAAAPQILRRSPRSDRQPCSSLRASTLCAVALPPEPTPEERMRASAAMADDRDDVERERTTVVETGGGGGGGGRGGGQAPPNVQTTLRSEIWDAPTFQRTSAIAFSVKLSKSAP